MTIFTDSAEIRLAVKKFGGGAAHVKKIWRGGAQQRRSRLLTVKHIPTLVASTHLHLLVLYTVVVDLISRYHCRFIKSNCNPKIHLT